MTQQTLHSKHWETKDADTKLFEQAQCVLIEYAPWQIGIFKDGMMGKFVWYPKKGTLMYQTDPNDHRTAVKFADGANASHVITLVDKKIEYTNRCIDQKIKETRENISRFVRWLRGAEEDIDELYKGEAYLKVHANNKTMSQFELAYATFLLNCAINVFNEWNERDVKKLPADQLDKYFMVYRNSISD